MENTRPGDPARLLRQYADSLLIEMRHLDAVEADTHVTLFGRVFDTPIGTAALSHLDKFGYHKDGMVELSHACAAVNALNFAGMGSEEEMERMVATGAAVVKIVKPHQDNERVLAKLRHAKCTGAFAVGMDIDHAFSHDGRFDVVQGEPMAPKSTKELRSFVEATDLPFIVKGVHSVIDAVKCVEAGARGLVVSHHHGMIDYAVPPLQLLPDIRRAVGPNVTLFVDCGIEGGYDTFKALALGADAVCVGRALLDPLKKGGREGAAAWMHKETEVLKYVLARTGSPDPAHVDATVLHGV